MKDDNVDRVREYVRAHRNREFAPGRMELRSKPLRQIALELDMQPEDVRTAMLACGWYQAVVDAENAHRVPDSRTIARNQPKFRPWGPEE